MYFPLKLPLISCFPVKVCFHACFEVLGSALSSTLSLAENRLTLLEQGQAISACCRTQTTMFQLCRTKYAGAPCCFSCQPAALQINCLNLRSPTVNIGIFWRNIFKSQWIKKLIHPSVNQSNQGIHSYATLNQLEASNLIFMYETCNWLLILCTLTCTWLVPRWLEGLF